MRAEEAKIVQEKAAKIDLPGAWFRRMERDGAMFLLQLWGFPQLCSPCLPTVTPCKTLQPTSAVPGGPRVCSALGRTCLGPAGGDAEPWQGVCPQVLAGWASPSPHTLPVVEAHGGTNQEFGREWGWGPAERGEINHYFIPLLVRCEWMWKNTSCVQTDPLSQVSQTLEKQP